MSSNSSSNSKNGIPSELRGTAIPKECPKNISTSGNNSNGIVRPECHLQIQTLMLQRCKSLDQFELGSQLGKGQFSEVFGAKHKLTGTAVALKQIAMDLLESNKSRVECQKEVELLKQLQHENIIRYYSSFVVKDQSKEYLIIVLELAEAGDLNQLLQHFVQIARALAHMHSKSIMHRDIKPANIFISSNGQLKLGDFGFGRFLSMNTLNTSSSSSLHHNGGGMVHTQLKTLARSPELVNGWGYSFKSDIWSLGCVLYEMAALQPPFFSEKNNPLALIRKISKAEYPPFPGHIYSKQLGLTVAQCVCANPAKRFSAGDVLAVAEHMVAHLLATTNGSPDGQMPTSSTTTIS